MHQQHIFTVRLSKTDPNNRKKNMYSELWI